MSQEHHTVNQRKWKQLTEKERYQIEALLESGMKAQEIGKQLGKDRRTIEREIKKGSVPQKTCELIEYTKYCADAGQRVHETLGENKGRGLKIGNDHKLAKYIEDKIKNEKYSPDAVIGEIKEQGLEFETSICTKTLYNYIENNVFHEISNQDLVVKKNKKQRRYRQVRKVALNHRNGRSIEARPNLIEKREEYGHWEMDSVVGKGKACLLVLTERSTRQEIIFKMASKTQESVKKVIDRLERKHGKKFRNKFKSITMDNGGEFIDQAGIEASCLQKDTKRTICYYAHPYSSWERGSNEVNNKLIRRFIPKGQDIGKYTQKEIKRIELWMNNYPRRIFGYKSANQLYLAISV
jgi:transposase, IS30 family